MTFELNIKCLWQHPATSNHLEITKIEWGEASDPIVITAHSVSQLQPGNWKFPIKPGTEAQTNLLSAIQEFTKFPHFKNTHPLTRHLVRELIRQCQSSTSDDQATIPKRNKTNHGLRSPMVEVSYFYIINLALFWRYRFHSGTLYKNLDVVLTVVEPLL